MEEMYPGENSEGDLATIPARTIRTESRKIQVLRQEVVGSGSAESVHDLRVSIRRVRTVLHLFGPILTEDIRKLEDPLRTLFRELGEIRTLDIAVRACDELEPAVRQEVIDRLLSLRNANLKTVVSDISAHCVLDDLASLSISLPTAGSVTGLVQPIRVAHRGVVRSFHRIAKSREIADVHRLRRRVKRLRYAVEFFEPEYGPPAKAYAKGIVEMQDQLGKTMDMVSLRSLFQHLGKISQQAAKACKQTARHLDLQVRHQKRCASEWQKGLSGKAWKDLKSAIG